MSWAVTGSPARSLSGCCTRSQLLRLVPNPWKRCTPAAAPGAAQGGRAPKLSALAGPRGSGEGVARVKWTAKLRGRPYLLSSCDVTTHADHLSAHMRPCRWQVAVARATAFALPCAPPLPCWRRCRTATTPASPPRGAPPAPCSWPPPGTYKRRQRRSRHATATRAMYGSCTTNTRHNFKAQHPSHDSNANSSCSPWLPGTAPPPSRPPRLT